MVYGLGFRAWGVYPGRRERDGHRRRDQVVRLSVEGTVYPTEMCGGSEEGSYLRLMDLCITQL